MDHRASPIVVVAMVQFVLAGPLSPSLSMSGQCHVSILSKSYGEEKVIGVSFRHYLMKIITVQNIRAISLAVALFPSRQRRTRRQRRLPTSTHLLPSFCIRATYVSTKQKKPHMRPSTHNPPFRQDNVLPSLCTKSTIISTEDIKINSILALGKTNLVSYWYLVMRRLGTVGRGT